MDGILGIIITVLIIWLIFAVVFNLLTSPWFWLIIAVLVVYGWVRRYMLRRQMRQYNEERRRQEQAKRDAYYSRSQYQQGSDDVIDVTYTEKDD